MKKTLNFILLGIAFATFVGCDKDNITGIMVVDNYAFVMDNEVVDTLYLSDQAHNLSFAIKSQDEGRLVYDWQLFQVAEYDYTSPVEARPWTALTMGLKDIRKPFEIGWATLQERSSDGEERLWVAVQANDSPIKRAYRISVGKETHKNWFDTGQIVLIQDATTED